MNRVRTKTGKAGAACRQRQAQSCREDRRGRCQDLSLAIMDTAITAGPMPTASFASSSTRPLHPRAGLRRQIRHPDRGAQSIGGRRSASLQGALGGRARFANLKDVLDMRPIYHRTDDRVQAAMIVARRKHAMSASASQHNNYQLHGYISAAESKKTHLQSLTDFPRRKFGLVFAC